MARSASGLVTKGTRPASRWSSSAATRRAILDAARRCFSASGYENTSVADIVAESGISVGSIYHQIGGKAEIFAMVVEELHMQLGRESRQAMASLEAAGETDPVELYLRGMSAYLRHSWRDRELNKLILSDDHPPGFTAKQQEYAERVTVGLRAIQLGRPPSKAVSDQVIMSLVRGATAQLMELSEESAADALIEYFVTLIRALARPAEYDEEP